MTRPTSSSSLDDDTMARLRLLCLENVSPSRLAWLVGPRDPQSVVEAMRAGRLPDDLGPPPPGLDRATVTGWYDKIRTVDPLTESVLAANRELGIRTMSPRDPDWPLADDPEPPILLFLEGDIDLLQAGASVAVVGTRRCTTVGRTVADRLGRDLARAGGTVVSGLALGVDGAAHRGALDEGGGVIGIVGSGLDVVYPQANRRLWDEVGSRGLLISEAPAGARPRPWRFPARNRLIAALSEATVVVESHRRGGALSTADEAIRRDRPVMAIPGSVLSPASEGTNALLVDGAIPVRDAADILAYLGHPVPGPAPSDPSPSGDLFAGSAAGEGEAPRLRLVPTEGVGARILAEVATGPRHLDDLVGATGLSVADVLSAVQQLQADNLVELEGSTVSPVGPPR